MRAQRQRTGEPLEAYVVVGENHPMFRREVPVKGALGDPDVGGDVGNAGLMHAVGDKPLHRRVQ